MIKKDIDKIIKNSLKNNIDVPKELGKTIITTTNEIYKSETRKKSVNRYKCLKTVAAMCAIFILTTTIVFGKNINRYVRSVFNLEEHDIGEKQINSAISDNYIQYNGDEFIDYGDIKYKLEYSLINDINLIFSINVKTEFNIDEFNDFAISGLKITDESGKQIYIDSEDEKIWTSNIAISEMHNKIQKSKNEISGSVILISPQFPQLNKIYISFDKITLYTITDGIVNKKEIDGNYNLELKIDEKFNNRNVTNYTCETISNKCNIDIEKAILTNTGLGITIKNPAGYETYGYTFEILNDNNEVIYSKTNNINVIGKTDKFFVWLDIDENVKQSNKFKLKINNLNDEESIFGLTKENE